MYRQRKRKQRRQVWLEYVYNGDGQKGISDRNKDDGRGMAHKVVKTETEGHFATRTDNGKPTSGIYA